MDKTKDSLAVQQVDDANAVSDSLTGKIDHNAAAQFEASETSATFSEAVKNNKTALGWCEYLKTLQLPRRILTFASRHVHVLYLHRLGI